MQTSKLIENSLQESKEFMQLQIECNQIPSKQQSCLICNQLFEMTEAKIIVCDDQGESYGEVCSECLEKGFYWLSDRFEHLN